MTRARRWSVPLLVSLIVAGALLVIRQPPEGRRAADFTVLYSVALLARHGHADSIYDQARLSPVLDMVSAHTIAPIPFGSPLPTVLPFIPLTFLPVEPAFWIWRALCLAMLAAAVAVLSRSVPISARAPAFGLLGILAAAPTWTLVLQGQYTALSVLGAALIVAAGARGGTVLAVAGGGLLALKPQYLPFYLLLLWGLRRYREAAGAGLAGVAVVMSALAAGGVAGLSGMLTMMSRIAAEAPARLNESWVGTLGSLLPAEAAGLLSAVLYGLALAGLGLLALRGRAALLPFGVLAGWLGVLASPHAFPHDLVLLLVPVWLAFDLARRGLLPSPIAALALTEVALIADLHGLPITLAPLMMTGGLVVYGRAFTRLATTPARNRARAA